MLCFVLSLAAGCTGPAERTDFTPLESRTDVVPGRRLILPVTISGPISVPPDLRLDRGDRPPAAIYWISVVQNPEKDPRAWLKPAGTWHATPAASATRPSAVGVWALAIDLPPDARNQGLWLSGRRIALNWVGDGSEPIPTIRPVRQPPPDLLSPERLSPPRRWRSRIIDGGSPAPFDDPILEALAAQAESRWAVALSRIEREQPALAHELLQRLALIVDFGPLAAPAWPTDDHILQNLLDDLLAPGLDAPRRAARVRAWLSARPAAIAWVSDDAAGPAAAPEARVQAANLLGDGVLAGAAPDDGSLLVELVPLPPHTVGTLEVRAAPSPQPARLLIRAGAWEQAMVTPSEPTPARPPGLTIGPLLQDWSMETWLAGTPLPALEDQRTALRLMRDGPGWAVYIEAAADPEREDVIRLWLGRSGASSSVLRISSEGYVIDEAGGPGTHEASRTSIARLPDGRWSCKVAVPAASIVEDGVLRLGVERVDSAGRRSAWPRPMLPWQVEPGRLLIDTRQWGDLGPGHAGPGAASPDRYEK